MGRDRGRAAARPTPAGFPPELLARVRAASGRGVICNRPTTGSRRSRTTARSTCAAATLILYTTQDSVLQLAAHVDVVARGELLRACAQRARASSRRDAVGRVIARPFAGAPGAFERTDGRRDFALPPPARSYLTRLQEAGVRSTPSARSAQLFAGVGFDVAAPRGDQRRGAGETTALIGELESGLVFTNLIETDQVYGHRQDAAGLRGALADDRRGASRAGCRGWATSDLLVLTADHGCDPTAPHTDHTREHAPLLAALRRPRRAPPRRPARRRRRQRADWLSGRQAPGCPGEPFPWSGRCPSFPRSRRSAASSRRTSGAHDRAAEMLDPRWTRPVAPQPVADALAGAADRARRRARQVPDLGARATTSTC